MDPNNNNQTSSQQNAPTFESTQQALDSIKRAYGEVRIALEKMKQAIPQAIQNVSSQVTTLDDVSFDIAEDIAAIQSVAAYWETFNVSGSNAQSGSGSSGN